MYIYIASVIFYNNKSYSLQFYKEHTHAQIHVSYSAAVKLYASYSMLCSFCSQYSCSGLYIPLLNEILVQLDNCFPCVCGSNAVVYCTHCVVLL